MKNAPLHSKKLLDYGWGAGLAIVLLQLVAFTVPGGEGRDWLYYYVIAVWAVVVIGSSFASRWCDKMHLPQHALRSITPFKILCVVYAVAVMTYYGIVPLIGWQWAWIWCLALIISGVWLQQLAIKDVTMRLLSGVGLLWFLICSIHACLYLAPRIGFAIPLQTYALPFIVSLAFMGMVMCRLFSDTPPQSTKKAYAALYHVMVLYILALIHFRLDGWPNRFALHHWKAVLEPAASVRAGGWLLWDVPSQYGFLQTWLLAALPTDSVWQSLYLLNGTLLVLSGYMIFLVLYVRYRSLSGFIFCLTIAVSSTMIVWRGLSDARMIPSIGPMRFFWIYPLVGYVLYLCRSFASAGRLPRCTYLAGNLLWLLGALWSAESAVFVTIIWIPCLMLIAVAQALSRQEKPTLSTIARKLSGLAGVAAGAVAVLALIYYIGLGRLPDVSLFAAYAHAYVGGYDGLTLTTVRGGTTACWLFIFVIMVIAFASYLAHAAITAPNVLGAAVFYAAIAGLWVAFSYYLPDSRDFKLIGMLPLLVFLSGILLVLLPTLPMTIPVKVAYEKLLCCVYAVVLLATVSKFDQGLLARVNYLSPLSDDVTALLPRPPALLQELVAVAGVPEHAHVLTLARAETDMEGTYFPGLQLQPWLYPNILTGYGVPLPPASYQEIGERRAVRLEAMQGWVFERTDYPLDRYPWIRDAIVKYYTEIAVFENSHYRIRKYEKRITAQ